MPDKKNIKDVFAYNLARIRKSSGLSQKALAEKSGLAHNFINDIESEKRMFHDYN